MSRGEFSIIQRHFANLGCPNRNTQLSVGDDAAVLDIPDGQQLVVSTDTLISGVHFLPDTSPADIAWKALAVNLSDLAAMAADPGWFLLSINLPDQEEYWLQEFSASLDRIAKDFQLELIGGDTCRGDLSITISIMGTVPREKYLRRSGARPGDLILVTGELGLAARGLAHLQNRIELSSDLKSKCVDALLRPRPRLELRSFLREYATAAIDVSDGLQADLAHILKASQCGARLQGGQLPVDSSMGLQEAVDFALHGGDDYQICCCLDRDYESEIDCWNQANPECLLSQIGVVTESGYILEFENSVLDLSEQSGGYRHFE